MAAEQHENIGRLTAELADSRRAFDRAAIVHDGTQVRPTAGDTGTAQAALARC